MAFFTSWISTLLTTSKLLSDAMFLILREIFRVLLCQASVGLVDGKRRWKFSVVVAASSAGEMPRSSARAAAVWATYAGSFRWLRRGMGARKGASVSTRMWSAGAKAAASRMLCALG